MDFYKLDKIDKIVISIIFIFGALFSILNNFVFASDVEELSPSYISNVGFDANGTKIVSSTGGRTYYFNIEPGYIYHITNGTYYEQRICYSDVVPTLDSPITYVTSLYADETYTFYGSSVGYIYCDYHDGYNVIVTREKSPGLNEAIFSLSDNVSGQLIWESIENAMPFILVCTTFGLGTIFIHRLIKSGSRGKAKLF